MGKKDDKGRLPDFVPLLLGTMNSPAWRALSHGAKVLYVALKRRAPRGRGRAYLSYRHAQAELRSSQRKIGEWFRELQHYGFIVLIEGGCLGVDGKGKSPLWRLTELGATSKASSGGNFEPPTNDFLRWDGVPFQKQKPASYGGCTPLPTSEAVALPTGDAPKRRSASYGVRIGNKRSASDGVCITSLTTPTHANSPSREGKSAFEKERRP